MEAAAGVAATRSGSIPLSLASSSRKEWRAVSEHQPGRNAGYEVGLEHSKMDQSEDRIVYELQRALITVNGSLDNDLLQQRLHNVSRQREQLQQVETDIRAQMIARSEIIEMQNNFDAQIKEHANAATRVQEQLFEKEQRIHDLQRRIEEKDRELHATKIDNEAAWAKEGLLREQNKELASFRREHDHVEAERGQHMKQIHELQEHIQEKERLLIELQEQHRVAQETIHYKDGQLREAQNWISRVQEMDVMQSTTHHSLQAELRDRTEQYNQLWMGCQRQFADMERLHLHTIQQLQHELTEAREKNGSYTEDTHISQTNPNDVARFGQSDGKQQDANVVSATNANSAAPPNKISESLESLPTTENTSTATEHAPGVVNAPSSLLGMPAAYIPPGQVAALHSFVTHQQGMPQSVPPHVEHYQSNPALSPMQHWQNQQTVSDGPQSTQNQFPQYQADKGMVRLITKNEYDMSANGQGLPQDYLDVHLNQGKETGPLISSATEKAQVFESIDENYHVDPHPDKYLQNVTAQFQEALRLDTFEQNRASEHQENILNNHAPEGQRLTVGQKGSAISASLCDTSVQLADSHETTVSNGISTLLPEAPISHGTMGRTLEIPLLDERSLLACIARTVPAGGRIRINSTLPNRLGKMLAPLHWHDYKKKYGKLDDFIGSHPELFVIEDEYIQLREGAQKMIAATAAVAKVAAAAASPSPYSSFLTVTPVAQSNRLKKVPLMNSNHVKPDNVVFKQYALVTPNANSGASQLSAIQSQLPNGVSFGLAEGHTNVKILSKDHLDANGAANYDRSKVSTQGRPNSNFVMKQQGRTPGPPVNSRR